MEQNFQLGLPDDRQKVSSIKQLIIIGGDRSRAGSDFGYEVWPETLNLV